MHTVSSRVRLGRWFWDVIFAFPFQLMSTDRHHRPFYLSPNWGGDDVR